jgi:hypothetical protein
VLVYSGTAPAVVDVQLWDLRGFRKHVVFSRRIRVHGQGEQETAFRWRLDASGNYTGHNLLPADLLRNVDQSSG